MMMTVIAVIAIPLVLGLFVGVSSLPLVLWLLMGCVCGYGVTAAEDRLRLPAQFAHVAKTEPALDHCHSLFLGPICRHHQEKDDQHRWRICHGPVSSTAATVAA